MPADANRKTRQLRLQGNLDATFRISGTYLLLDRRIEMTVLHLEARCAKRPRRDVRAADDQSIREIVCGDHLVGRGVPLREAHRDGVVGLLAVL